MQDPFVVRAVVCFLGITVLLGVALGGYLALEDRGVPDFVVAVTSGAIGALSALLSRTSSGTESVHVVNPTNDPVPVDATHP